jgi:hypothetical protein
MTTSRHKIGARAEFRRQEGRRIMDSATLSDRFPKLKSLRADLSFCTPDGATSSSQLKYLVNLDHTKSVFRFDCLNRECVHGDFDLSEALADAVAARKKIATGELRCPGWRNKDSIQQIYCRRILRYKLSLGW